MRTNRIVAATVAGITLTALLVPAAAQAAVEVTRDLTTPGRLRIAGSEVNPIGNQVALLGDVNGDGIGDLATAGGSDPSLPDVGRVVVVFGRRTAGRIETDPLPAGAGFRINGVAFDFSTRPFGPSIAAAGDVNGDGFADILVGASGFRLPDGTATGRAHVIFGRRNPADVDVRSLPAARGFTISPPANYRVFAYQVAGIGDVNRDGLADIAIGASGTGVIFEVHVLYGRRGGDIDLGAWTSALGWRVSGHTRAPDGWETISLGNAIAGLGDVNRDGIPDIAIGAPSDAPQQDPNFWGAVYVVYGGRRTDLSTADLGCATCGRNGIRITGGVAPFGGWEIGSVVSGPGDVNGDGTNDILIGTNFGRLGAHVVFGQTANPAVIRLAGSFRGFAIQSPTSGPGDACCHPGHRVAPAGDVNGDGRADLLVGNGADSPTVSGVRRDSSGQVFVIYGRTGTTLVDVDNLPARAGFRIVGGLFLDGFNTGSSVDGGRDMTGDGRGDLVIGSQLLPGDPGANVSGVDVLAR